VGVAGAGRVAVRRGAVVDVVVDGAAVVDDVVRRRRDPSRVRSSTGRETDAAGSVVGGAAAVSPAFVDLRCLRIVVVLRAASVAASGASRCTTGVVLCFGVACPVAPLGALAPAAPLEGSTTGRSPPDVRSGTSGRVAPK